VRAGPAASFSVSPVGNCSKYHGCSVYVSQYKQKIVDIAHKRMSTKGSVGRFGGRTAGQVRCTVITPGHWCPSDIRIRKELSENLVACAVIAVYYRRLSVRWNPLIAAHSLIAMTIAE
jgi:hypothetical protein